MKGRILLGLLLLAPTAWAQLGATYEETVVRNAYAKASYVTQLTVIGDTAMETWADARPDVNKPLDRNKVARKLEDAKVTFVLTDFKVGPLEQINQKRWLDVITVPSPPLQLLKFDLGGQSWQDDESSNKSWYRAFPAWKDPDEMKPEWLKALENVTVARMIEVGGKQMTYTDVVYTRYATYNVTATFQGKTVGPYRSLFLFGKNSQGREVAAPEDLIVDTNMLFTATEQSLYPEGLLRSQLRDTPVVREWLANRRMTDDACTVGKESLCCINNRCGFAGADLDTEMRTALDHKGNLR